MTAVPLVLVRGIGDVGSAVAHVLFRRGYAVVIHDGPAPPTAHRCAIAFTDAVFDGTASLDGVHACRIDVLDYLAEQAAGQLFVAVVIAPAEAVLGENRSLVLVMALGSIAGTFIGGRLLVIIPFHILLPLLALILVLSAIEVWRHN